VARAFRFAFEAVSDLTFGFRYVSTSFDHTTSFLSVTFRLEPYTVGQGEKKKALMTLELGQLFEVNPFPDEFEFHGNN